MLRYISIFPAVVNIKRVKNIKTGPAASGPVLYWMSRDQRVSDNWALSYAVEIAESIGQPVLVVYNVVDDYLNATWRQFDFMLKGLRKVEVHLKALNIPFSVLIGNPEISIVNFISQNKISHLVTDFDPLKIKREWQRKIAEKIDISFDVVDAHNIVPCQVTSDKAENSAASFRPKIKRLLPEFLDEYPPLIKQRGNLKHNRINWEAIAITLKTDHSVRPIEWLVPGEKAAMAVFEKFLEKGIDSYAQSRNDPNEMFTSGLSPYLHFGHISAQRIALKMIKGLARDENTDAFLEELIVRKELSDNFCFYEKNYDTVSAFKHWAIESLNAHRADKREFIYPTDQFEKAQTHDSLWNAAQLQIFRTGNLNGYLRMYWAKKILEWSANPEEALKTAIYLNNKYQLDGRDPNGYTGCAWSIGGVHDRAWGDRKIFGKIRYMNRTGCKRKFDVDRYISNVNQIRKKI